MTGSRRPPVPVSGNTTFGTFGTRTAPEAINAVIPILANVLDHYAFLIDQGNDDTSLFVLLDGQDSELIAFRRGLQALREGAGWISERVEHLESRLKRTCAENGETLPPLPDHDGVPIGWILFDGQRRAEEEKG